MNCFQLKIRKFVDDLIGDGKIGTCKDFVRVDQIQSGSNVVKENNCDRFRLSIPYGGTTLKWQILFNSEEPHLPPDFIFGINEQDFEPDLEEIPSLQDWNPENPCMLTAVVKEIITQYKQHQSQLIKKYSKNVQFQYESLKPLDILNNTEVFMQQNAQMSQQKASFIIRLSINLSKLPAYLTNNNLGEDYISLHVLFEDYDGVTVTPRIYLSPRVEHAFVESSLQYPNWSAGDECLVSYIALVQSFFVKKVEEITSQYEYRRDYVASFLSSFGSAVVEYDAEAFTKIAFLFEVQGFYCILKIEIGRNFPDEQPVFLLQSIYHVYNDGPYEAKDHVYPYSPRWSSAEMAERARLYLQVAIPAFKTASMSNRPYQPPQC